MFKFNNTSLVEVWAYPEEYIAVYSTMVGIDSINIILHIIGISLLTYLYRHANNKPQQIYLMNLSWTELIWSMCAFAHDVMALLIMLGKPIVDKEARYAIQYVLYTGLTINMICAMFFVTGDRIVQVIYGMRYGAYWTRRKSLELILVTWFFKVTTSVVFGMLRYFNNTALLGRIGIIIRMYVVPSMNAAYLLFAIFCYTVVFIKLFKSRQRFQNSSSSSTSSCSTIYQLIFRSKFSISILIINSYLLFTVIPNVTATVWYFAFQGEPWRAHQIFLYFYHISIRFSCTVDALIYIFLHPNIQDLIRKLIFRSQNGQPQMEIPSAVQKARARRQEEHDTAF